MEFKKYSDVSEYALPYLRRKPKGIVLYLSDSFQVKVLSADGKPARDLYKNSPDMIIGLYKLTPFHKARDICDMIIEDMEFISRPLKKAC